MILASSLKPGKADALVNLADDLAAFVQQAVQQGSDLDTVERGTLTRVLAIGFAAVDLFLKGQGNGRGNPHRRAGNHRRDR